MSAFEATHEAEEYVPIAELSEHAGRLAVAEQSRPRYNFLTNPYDRMDYAHMTDDLITTLDGSAESVDTPYDAVVYLDSSARPVSWMVRGLWEYAAAHDEQGNVVNRPPTYFANIDGRRTNEAVDDVRTERLRNTFPGLIEFDEADAPKKVLIVDETAVSGQTLRVAHNQFSAAFPHVQFDEYAWMDQRGRSKNEIDNPRWYERAEDRMRSVLDPSDLKPQQKAQLEERGIGSNNHWLSVPNPDKGVALELRRDIDNLIEDVMSGDIPYWPSMKRSSDDVIALIPERNEGLSAVQFRQFREWFKRYYAPSPAGRLVASDKHGPLSEREARLFMAGERPTKPPILDDQTSSFAKARNYV